MCNGGSRFGVSDMLSQTFFQTRVLHVIESATCRTFVIERKQRASVCAYVRACERERACAHGNVCAAVRPGPGAHALGREDLGCPAACGFGPSHEPQGCYHAVPLHASAFPFLFG